MTSAKPSLELLRELSDEHVLRALMSENRLTRAELATRTGISKPTVAESIRRLEAAGVVIDTGERTTGRGRVGTYYALDSAVGTAAAIAIAPEGITVEIVDAHGSVLTRAAKPVRRPVRPRQIKDSLRGALLDAQTAVGRVTRLAVISAADPVDRATGRLRQLPDSPFLLGDLSPAVVIGDMVEGPVVVDNDVHWAARAERSAASPKSLDDFVYLYLGEGLGCAVVSDGEVRRGHSGVAGEIAHVVTTNPGHAPTSFIDLFEALGVRHEGTTAIDVAALTAAVTGGSAKARRTRRILGSAVADVISAAVAFADPEIVIIGGPWGTDPTVVDAVREACATRPRSVRLRAAQVTHEAPLAGARAHAVAELQTAITRYRSA